MFVKKNLLIYFLLLPFVLDFVPLLNALFYSDSSSSFGLVSSVSVPVVEYFPERRILFDWCFVMSYDLPYKLDAFYNIPIWPMKNKRRSSRELMQNATFVPQHFAWYQKYNEFSDTEVNRRRHPSDFSAGELYQGIEDMLVSYGYHDTCLLRTVCELAKHPFDERHQNILTEILTFFLTPSAHEAFDETEHLYRESYEAAELQGFMGKDCELIFNECKMNFLSSMSKVIFTEK